jgi:hypothetical protein
MPYHTFQLIKRHIAANVNRIPMRFIHMPAGFDVRERFPQEIRFKRVALEVYVKPVAQVTNQREHLLVSAVPYNCGDFIERIILVDERQSQAKVD